MADGKIRSYNYVRAELFGKKPETIDKVIGLRSRPHRHSEYEFSERYSKLSFSSTKQNGDNGARFKDIKYSHYLQRWDTVIIPMTDEQEDLAYQEAQDMESMPYDTTGQLCHLFKAKWWKPSKWDMSKTGPDRGKSHCTRTVTAVVCKGREDFREFLLTFGIDVDEIRPDHLDMLARFYFEAMGKG